MKFLADMGLARSTVAFLRSRGHDAVHLRDEGLQRLGDDQIVQKARSEGRVILTHDLDFGRILALSREQLPSVITFRLEDMRPAQVNYYLSEVLARFAEQVERGALISVHERGIRVRLLPVGEVHAENSSDLS
jgi:predicted nuclease of predicted toxin-antitoxin system